MDFPGRGLSRRKLLGDRCPLSNLHYNRRGRGAPKIKVGTRQSNRRHRWSCGTDADPAKAASVAVSRVMAKTRHRGGQSQRRQSPPSRVGQAERGALAKPASVAVSRFKATRPPRRPPTRAGLGGQAKIKPVAKAASVLATQEAPDPAARSPTEPAPIAGAAAEVAPSATTDPTRQPSAVKAASVPMESMSRPTCHRPSSHRLQSHRPSPRRPQLRRRQPLRPQFHRPKSVGTGSIERSPVGCGSIGRGLVVGSSLVRGAARRSPARHRPARRRVAACGKPSRRARPASGFPPPAAAGPSSSR